MVQFRPRSPTTLLIDKKGNASVRCVVRQLGAMNMKRRRLIIILALATSFPVAAAEKQSEQSLGRQQQTYTPSLAVVMGLIQISHFKLWLAGNLRNWPLPNMSCRK
jgi:hypothetical protein